MLTFSKKSQKVRESGVSSTPVAAESEREEEQPIAEREAIVRRLRLQGAVQVLPSRFPPSGDREEESAQEAEAEAESEAAGAGPARQGAGVPAPGGSDAPDRPYDGVEEYVALERLRKQLKAAAKGKEDSGAPADLPEALKKRLELHESGALPMAKWYKKRAKEYEQEQEWNVPPRERSGGRRRDVNMEQDIEEHLTREHLRKMNPGLLAVRQHWRNFRDDFKQHKLRSVVGLAPVVGPGIAQYDAASEAGRTRDVMLGMSQVQQDEQLAEQTRHQATAIDKTIDAGWWKAGIGTITSTAGLFSPVPGATGAANMGAGKLVDKAYSESGKTVQEMTARMRARKDMRKDEYRDYEDEQEFILLEKLAGQFRKGGKGDEDSGMMSELSPELQRRLMAHINGMIGNRKEMAKKAKSMMKDRNQQFKAGLEPGPETGILAKFKGLFSRSKGNQTG